MSKFKRFVTQFKDKDGITWSEVLYHRTEDKSLFDVRTDATDLLALRVMMLGAGVRVINAYVSDDDFLRDALYTGAPAPGKTTPFIYNPKLLTGFASQEDADFGWTTLLLRMRSGNRSTKAMYLSGVSDGLSVHDATGKIDDATWMDAYNKWYAELAKKWAWKGINTLTDADGRTNIKAVVEQGGFYKYTTVAAHGLKVGDWVTVAKTFGRNANANGVQLVRAVPEDDIFVGDRAAETAYKYFAGGWVNKRSYVLLPIDAVIIRHFTDHKRGGSVGLPRGRRKIKK